jgi:hypothetical protein
MEVEMKMVKSLLLGTAAGLVAVAGAQAADMPVKAAPVLFVKICSLYGDGYYYIPGTATCIKIGGYLRLQTEAHSGSSGIAWGSGNVTGMARFNRVDTNDINYTLRGLITLDVRDQTEYGTLRSYIRAGWDARAPDRTEAGTSPCNNSTANNCLAYWDRAFIQWAGFTVGKAQSFFDLFTQGGAYSYLNTRTSGDTGAGGELVWAYTAQFGGGLSATFSAEDPNGHNKANTVNTSVAGFFTSGSNGVSIASSNGLANMGGAINGLNNGFRVPDLVFNARVDQAWGFFGVSAALHDISANYYSVGPDNCAIAQCVNNGHPADQYGYAFAVGGLLNLPNNDIIGANFVWARGAIGYVQDMNNYDIFDNSNRRSIAWGVDGIFTNGGEIERTEGWSINAAYQHFWSPKWRTSFWAGYAAISYNGTATALINQGFGAGNICNPTVFNSPGATGATFTNVVPLAGNSCSPNYSFWQVGARTQWNPHPLLDIGLELFWTQYNTAYKGPVAWTAVNARPACTFGTGGAAPCVFDDIGVWSALFRWQRNFYP